MSDKRWTKPETIDLEFDHHPPASSVVAAVHERVRALLKSAAHELNDLLPECPLKTEAKNALRTAMWAANSAVACYGNQDPDWQDQAARQLEIFNLDSYDPVHQRPGGS